MTTKFNYASAKAEVSQIVTTSNNMLYVNGKAVMICQAYFAKNVIEQAVDEMDFDGLDTQSAVTKTIDLMRSKEVSIGGEFKMIDTDTEAQILAETPQTDDSILAKYNGFCAVSGWPIIANVHNIVAGKRNNSWIRTDKI